jgi:Zn-dependent protease with chaperone function
MLSKPINIVLVYILTVLNVAILTLPLVVLVIPFLKFTATAVIIPSGIFSKLKFSFLFLLFLVSFLMLIYLFLDFIFGFSIKSSLKGCTRYEKIKDYDFLSEIFDQIKNKFGEKNVKLYIKNSNEINAFAISSFNSKIIVLTRGLISHYLVECPDPKSCLYALRSTMGHEMSHLINKDFLPTFLIIINQKITNFISSIISFFFTIAVNLMAAIPGIGYRGAIFVRKTEILFSFLATAFNRFIVYNFYEFLRRFLSRSNEYRCDLQSAQAFSGNNMAFALSMLGDSGYFTLFSTHPSTKARINRVKEVKPVDEIISIRFFDALANHFSIMFLIFSCLYFAKQSSVDLMVRQYINNHEKINQKLILLWNLLNKLF